MKRRTLAIRPDGIKDDDLYLYIENLITEHGSFRAVVEDLVIRDKEDRLGKELRKVKNEIVQDVVGELKGELDSLKQYIDDQFSKRVFALNEQRYSNETINDLLEEDEHKQVYKYDALEISGDIDEEYDLDF